MAIEKRHKLFQTQVAALASSGGVLLVDSDNVRGKRCCARARSTTGPSRHPLVPLCHLSPPASFDRDSDSLFRVSHELLLTSTARWAACNGLSEHAILLVDHGSVASSFHLPKLGVSIAFSGPACSADDVAARDVGWLLGMVPKVLLCTADSGLILRCRRAAMDAHSVLQVAPPQALLSALGHDRLGSPPVVHSISEGTKAGVAMPLDDEQLGALEDEMRARAALTRAERAVRRAGGNSRKRKPLQMQRKALREALETAMEHSSALGSPLLEEVVTIAGHAGTPTSDGADDASASGAAASGAAASGASLSPAEQEAILDAVVARRAQLPEARRPTEHTFERVVLAERLRRRLERRAARKAPTSPGEPAGVEAVEPAATPAAAYVARLQGAHVQLPPTGAHPANAAAAMNGGVGALMSAAPFVGGGGGSDAISAAELASTADVGTVELLPLPVVNTTGATGEEQEPQLELRKLCVRQCDMSRPICGSGGRSSKGAGRTRRERRRKRRYESLEWSTDGSYVPRQGGATQTVAMSASPPEGGMPMAGIGTASSTELAPVEHSTRLVVVSDTHGREATLTASRGTALGDPGRDDEGSGQAGGEEDAMPLQLPSGDVLVHCGDCAITPAP